MVVVVGRIVYVKWGEKKNDRGMKNVKKPYENNR